MDVPNLNFVNTVRLFEKILNDPNKTLHGDGEYNSKIVEAYQHLYECLLSCDVAENLDDILKQLIVEDMDDSQIWQQIDLCNSRYIDHVVEKSSRMLSARKDGFEVHFEEDSKSSVDQEGEKEKLISKPSKIESKKLLSKNTIDYFADDLPDNTNKEYPISNEESDMDEDSDDGEDNENNEEFSEHDDSAEVDSKNGPTNELFNEDSELKSSYEIKQQQVARVMEKYEAAILGESDWQMRGETVATKRPKNSLLEEMLDFEMTTKPAPIVTEMTTKSLETIIRQRIKDEVWDDVVRVAAPVSNIQTYKKSIILDGEKPKESLAQFYENQYKASLENAGGNTEGDTLKVKSVEHQLIYKKVQSLLASLDNLSNFHLTARPVAPEVKIILNTPAIFSEEAAPIAVSSEKFVSPEETFKSHNLIGKSEQTKQDKNRKLHKLKQTQKLKTNKSKKREASDLKQLENGTLKKFKANGKHNPVQTKQTKFGSNSTKTFFSKMQDRIKLQT